ncbi:hypothetical protein A2W14_06255 [Candidatus Gottesmanbacteria bacterium RBG_16_37_8]|uniref:Uncharacterized protein n=1 Tax=Candidatus Gottesmanbacteria bacterium RBG_16_37_8 TaxID=1798371 RepID=A0A1F5YVC0_9BACT|nr:MAG: hypothetical protein A2W14_06255 [Candidatus Gottesmanbacteria bacterium RBG_16_37_8]
MIYLSDYWRNHGLHEKESLSELFHFLKTYLTESEWQSMARIIPHPISIDILPLYAPLVWLMEGINIELYSSEVFMPGVTEEIDAIETLNAAHPGRTNVASTRFSNHELLKKKNITGGADDHNPAFSGSTGTLTKVEEFSAEGIIAAFKKLRSTIPISGLGRTSQTDIPFPLWSWTIPVKGIFITPLLILNIISSKINIREPAQRAVEQEIFSRNNYQEVRAKGWFL